MRIVGSWSWANRDTAVNVLAVLGLALICGGLGLIWLPIGVIGAGVMMVLFAVVIGR